MEEIRRSDLQLFFREVVDPMRMIATAATLMLVWVGASSFGRGPIFGAALSVVTLASLLIVAWNASQSRRFHDPRLRALWQGCQDRLTRFEEVLKRAPAEQVRELGEMPSAVRRVASYLYVALRRADAVATEVMASEKGLGETDADLPSSDDAATQELYRLAQRNVDEYRAHYEKVMDGVRRAEAQATVFMTTLDTLRMKLLGYRLGERRTEAGPRGFLEALTDARQQIDSIDKALEELNR